MNNLLPGNNFLYGIFLNIKLSIIRNINISTQLAAIYWVLLMSGLTDGLTAMPSTGQNCMY